MPSFCWKCGRKLVPSTTGRNKGEIVSEIRDYHGAKVMMHRTCAVTFDKEEANDKFNWGKKDAL